METQRTATAQQMLLLVEILFAACKGDTLPHVLDKRLCREWIESTKSNNGRYFLAFYDGLNIGALTILLAFVHAYNMRATEEGMQGTDEMLDALLGANKMAHSMHRSTLADLLARICAGEVTRERFLAPPQASDDP